MRIMSTLTENLIHYAMTHGIIYGVKPQLTSPSLPIAASVAPNTILPIIPTLTVHAPITLFPYNYPTKSFHKAMTLGPIFNNLMDKVSRNSQWLNHILASTAESDEFTCKLLEIMNNVDVAFEKKSILYSKQQVSLGKPLYI